jgi:hypothetical protein
MSIDDLSLHGVVFSHENTHQIHPFGSLRVNTRTGANPCESRRHRRSTPAARRANSRIEYRCLVGSAVDGEYGLRIRGLIDDKLLVGFGLDRQPHLPAPHRRRGRGGRLPLPDRYGRAGRRRLDLAQPDTTL